MKNNQNGRSMVEMLGVLAIIGVLSAGGLAGYSKAMFKHKLNTTMDQITMLVTNIRTMYGTQGNYKDLDNTKASQLGIVPASMSNFKNPFKGDITVTHAAAKKKADGATTNPSDITGFTVLYTKLPKEACIALATADFGAGAGSGFIGVNVFASNETATSTAFVGSGVAGTGSPATGGRAEGEAYKMSDAISACSEQAQIIWKFY